MEIELGIWIVAWNSGAQNAEEIETSLPVEGPGDLLWSWGIKPGRLYSGDKIGLCSRDLPF